MAASFLFFTPNTDNAFWMFVYIFLIGIGLLMPR